MIFVVAPLAPVATRSAPTRAGFCPHCDSPIYADEGVCRHCGPPDQPLAARVPWDVLGLVLAGLVLLALVVRALIECGSG